MSAQLFALYIPDGVTPALPAIRQADGTYLVPVTCDDTGKLGVTGIAGGGGGSGDASAAKQDTQIAIATATRDRLPASIGPQAAAASLAVTLASDGPLVTAVGQPGDAAATSDTGSFGVLALIKRCLQNWTTLLTRLPALASGRVPVENRNLPVDSNITSLSGVAAGVTVYSGTIDLGANFSNVLLAAAAVQKNNQADSFFIQLSADSAFTTPFYFLSGPKASGASGLSWTNGVGTTVTISAIAVARYARAGFTCLSGGSAQPSTAFMAFGAVPGGV